MKLITEVVEDVKPLVEEFDGGVKKYMIEGIFLQANVRNRNDRVYPKNILENEVNRYVRDHVSQNRALGELGHPDSPQINLDRVSHLIVSLVADGDNFIGRAKIMDTPNGKIVRSFIDEGVKFGVSSRGVGTLKSTPNGNYVTQDFYLATAGDIVADPSAPSAFVRGIMEQKEWVWNNGILAEATIAQMKQELVSAPKKKAADRQIAEAKVYRNFIDAIRVDSTFSKSRKNR